METEEVVQEEQEKQEPHLTIAHAVGLIIMLLFLQLLLSLILAKSGSSILVETGWVNISISHALSGIITAYAGAILSGFMLISLLLPVQFKWTGAVPLLLSVFGISILSSEFSNLLQSIAPISEEYTKAFNGLLQQNRWGVLLTVGLAAPLTEELIFRGVMLEGLQIRYRLRTAVLVSTLFFALIHVFPWVILNAFLLGLFFAWLKLETESLLQCMIAHSLYNSLPFLLSAIPSFQISGYTVLPVDRVQFQPWWFDLLGVGLLAIGCVSIRFLSRAEALNGFSAAK